MISPVLLDTLAKPNPGRRGERSVRRVSARANSGRRVSDFLLQAKRENRDRRQISVTNKIKRLLKQRNAIFVQYCKLVGVKQLENMQQSEIKAAELARLCEMISDYVAIGHFEVYHRIIEHTERRLPVLTVSAQVQSDIQTTTNYLIDITEKYDGFEQADIDEQVQSTLLHDLLQIADYLTKRSDLENQLLAVY